jgi:hypothetical protein
MLKKMTQAMRRRVGPVSLSLTAAAVTAVAFAAISMAASDDDGKAEKGLQRGDGPDAGLTPPKPPALSEEDEAKLEEFRSCMEENGAPALPEPGEIRERLRNGERPDPPSEAEREKMRQAFEACEDKLPEGVHMFVGPGGPGCGPGGPPPARNERGEGQGDNQSQGFVVPAPAPSGTS